MRVAAILLLLVVAAAWSAVAQAHQINLSNARITINPDRKVGVEVAMKGSDVDRVAKTKVFDDRTGLVRPDALDAASRPIAGYVSTHAVVLGENGSPCRSNAGAVSPDNDGVLVRTRWSCANVSGKLKYRSTVLIDIAPDARQVVLISNGSETAQDLLDASRTEIALTDAPRPPLLLMAGMLFYLASSFWAGAVHAATPGHGKTISAAYIVGARGRPVDAVILGVFVTLSHTSGILLAGALASLGSVWLVPQRIEAYLGPVLGLLVVALGGWMLWTQRHLLGAAFGIPARSHAHRHDSHEVIREQGTLHEHEHAHAHAHGIEHSHPTGQHSHGWGTHHAHRLDLVSDHRPKLGVLLTLGVAGGLLPDPMALAILLAAISSGHLLLGLGTVLVFSLGFASALLLVGMVAVQVGQRVLAWLDSVWALRLQLATTLLILGMGVVVTVQAARQLVL